MAHARGTCHTQHSPCRPLSQGRWRVTTHTPSPKSLFLRHRSAEKVFLTGEELTVQGKIVCSQNDWNLVKQYYVQGIKGLLVVYNREVARTKRINLARNLALTGAVSGVTLAAFVYLVSASTLADPAELYRRSRGEEYMRSYYRRPDVVAAFWALGLVIFYYVATIMTYYLLQNLYG